LDWLESNETTRRFGAALFPRLKFIRDEDTTSFLVTKVKCKTLSQIIEQAIRNTHHSGCMATLFPELTIDDDARGRIQTLLQDKPWMDEPDDEADESLPPPRTPALVIAGSWHRRVEHGYANIASIYNGDGISCSSMQRDCHLWISKIGRNGLFPGKSCQSWSWTIA
jgi:hypothetical protein